MRSNQTPSGIHEITTVEVYELAKTWYENLDVHAPLETFIPLLAQKDLKMVFPEGTMTGFEGFKQWYERVVNLFFNEVHTLEDVTTVPKDDRAEVKVIVKWEASRWQAPAPHSERIIADAYQTWEVVRSPITGSPVILTYIVDSLEYENGSARL
ncbi:MAG: hypothetical protein WCA35_06625 [Kovacikia sp.]